MGDNEWTTTTTATTTTRNGQLDNDDNGGGRISSWVSFFFLAPKKRAILRVDFSGGVKIGINRKSPKTFLASSSEGVVE